MQSNTHPRRLTALAIALATAFAGIVPASAADTYKWTVQYLVDQSQVVFGQSQKLWPRRNRGLAVSPDGKYLYAGYHHGGNGEGEVRKLAIFVTDDYARATVRVLRGPLGKSIACDDKGRVYIANGGEIAIYDEDLSRVEHSIPVHVGEGVAVVREGNELIVYATDRQLALLQRYVIEEKGDHVVGAAPAGFADGSGVVAIPGATSLRGVEVDPKGNIWLADRESARVFRVGKDGKVSGKAEVENATDIAFLGDRAYVTRGTDRLIAVLDQDSMKVLGNLAIPWEELELSPHGNSKLGSLSGIVTIPGKGFYVSNETGQTARQMSTYGRADASTDFVEGKLYRDAFEDDGDPILRALEVQPGQ
jgi:hypothetical protein